MGKKFGQLFFKYFESKDHKKMHKVENNPSSPDTKI